MTFEQIGRPTGYRPGDRGVGKMIPQRAGDRHRLNNVADGTETDNEDVHFFGGRRSGVGGQGSEVRGRRSGGRGRGSGVGGMISN